METFTNDPCSNEAVPKLILTGKNNLVGSFHKASVSVKLFRENDAADGFRISIMSGGLPFQLGGDKLQGTSSTLTPTPDSEGKTECKWSTGDPIYAQQPPETRIANNVGTGISEGDKRIGKRFYTSDHADMKKEFHFAGIDTAGYFSYLNNHPASQTFNLSGTYYEVTMSGGEKTEIKEESSITLTIGLVDKKLEISGKEDVDYHNWLPTGINDHERKSLHAKAKLITDAEVKEDTLYFEVTEVSTYIGECSNYPRIPENAPKNVGREPDIVFSKVQDDVNVQWVDSFHVKTTKKVTEAYATIESRDYAGNAKLLVRSGKGVIGVSKYNSESYLSIPEDNNKNEIADQWEKEKDVNVFSKNFEKTWDDEGSPDTKRGDDIELFEEYRGFMILDDAGAPKFARLNPNHREIIVIDNAKSTNAKEWEDASDVKMMRMNETMINNPFDLETSKKDPYKWRIVDFNGKKKKHAIYILTYPGLEDPYCMSRDSAVNYDDKAMTDDGKPVWGAHICFFETVTGVLNFFPARIAETIKGYPQFTRDALDGTAEHAWLKDTFDFVARRHGMTFAQLAQKANGSIAKWNSVNLSDVTTQFSHFIIMHEMGHACRLSGHMRADKDSHGSYESTQGTVKCPMAYILFSMKMEMVIFSDPNGVVVPPLFAKTNFCHSIDFCYQGLDAKNQ